MENYKVEGVPQSPKEKPNDTESQETNTEDSIERLYHSWLGEVPNEDGIYERDPYLKKMMNKKCASMLRTEITSRFNDNMNYSDLDDPEIIEIASLTSENIMERLMFDFEIYEIDVSDIEPISQQVFDALLIWLKIAREGGMKQFKVARGQVHIHRQERIEQSPVH